MDCSWIRYTWADRRGDSGTTVLSMTPWSRLDQATTSNLQEEELGKRPALGKLKAVFSNHEVPIAGSREFLLPFAVCTPLWKSLSLHRFGGREFS